MVVKSGFSVNTSRAWVQFITPRSPRMFFLLKCFTEVVQFYNVSIWIYFYWTKLQLGLSNSSKTYTALSQGCFKYAMFHWIDAVKVLNSKYFHYETWRIIYCEYIFKAVLLQVFNHVEYCMALQCLVQYQGDVSFLAKNWHYKDTVFWVLLIWYRTVLFQWHNGPLLLTVLPMVQCHGHDCSDRGGNGGQCYHR